MSASWTKPTGAVDPVNPWQTLYMRASQTHDAMLEQMGQDRSLLSNMTYQDMRGFMVDLLSAASRATVFFAGIQHQDPELYRLWEQAFNDEKERP